MDILLFQPILHGPYPPVTASDEGGQRFIRHNITGNYLVATPEEWVRQNLLIHLQAIGYPAGLIATERLVRVGRMRRRYDVLVYDRHGLPFLVGECKAPEIRIGKNAQAQAAQYNAVLGARFVLLTNGLAFEVYEKAGEGYAELQSLPEFV